jgi:hypothetical protein
VLDVEQIPRSSRESIVDAWVTPSLGMFHSMHLVMLVDPFQFEVRLNLANSALSLLSFSSPSVPLSFQYRVLMGDHALIVELSCFWVVGLTKILRELLGK